MKNVQTKRPMSEYNQGLTLIVFAVLSFSFVCIGGCHRSTFPAFSHGSYDPIEPIRVKPVRTQWGNAWNHEEICRNMDTILKRSGVESQNARVRMIAHAIIASGWRQNVWNYNAWGVQQGSWSKQFFTMNTTEMDDQGNFFFVRNARWRAFRGWKESVNDYFSRIKPTSQRPSYRQAYRHLNDSSKKSDAAFWEALGKGNYYTTTQFTAKKFAILCNGIRNTIGVLTTNL